MLHTASPQHRSMLNWISLEKQGTRLEKNVVKSGCFKLKPYITQDEKNK